MFKFKDFWEFVKNIAYWTSWISLFLFIGVVLIITMPVWIIPYFIYRFIKWHKWDK